jgi:amino acid adenylation domain-containing protein
LNPVAGTGDAPGGSVLSGAVRWLDDGKHSLDWNGPATRIFTRFSDEDLDWPVIHHFEHVALRHPNHLAVSDAETSLSYTELWDGLSGLAETIAAQTRPGDLVGIILPACAMFPLALLACLAAGRPFVALDPHYPDNWLRQVLEDARPALIIGREGCLGGIETVARDTRIIHLTHPPQPAGKNWRPAGLGMDEPACVVFTSGSTGRPKGIVNSQRNLLQRVAQSINAAHINAADRFLTLASLCTIVGVRDTITALLAGAGIHLLDLTRAGARDVLRAIRTEAITILFAFPALLRSVIPHGGERAGDALRLVRVGGDTTLWSDVDLLRRWLAPDAAIQLIYAATEAPIMQWFVDVSCKTEDPRIPIGFPLAGNRLALIDADGRDTPPGEVGELIVGSPYVALGLWVDGRCTSGYMEIAGAPSCRLFRTGDLVRQRPDGLLERIGRKDRQVKIRGARVDLDGVEAILRRHPLLRDVGVVARPAIAAGGAVTLVAYVAARDGAHAGLLDELKEMVRSTPAPMRPARFYLVDKIPRLPGSKLDLHALMAMDAVTVRNERASVAAALGRATPEGDHIARTVAQVWLEVLQTPVSGPEDDFFDAGGDSLKAITFMIGLERALGLELSLTLIMEAPAFDGLCEALRERRTTRYAPLVNLKPGDGSPPLFIVPGLGGNVAGLFPMARRIEYPGAVIGIQARGLDGQEPPHATVEAMAAAYLREVKARQPAGPYRICGYSFGGVVAFEMACRLRESGEQVALVGLFDATMSPLRWPLGCWLSILHRRIVRFLAGAIASPIGRWPSSVRRMGRYLRESLGTLWKSARTGVLKVMVTGLIASARYRPGFYPGELTLFTPREREPGLPSLQAVWGKHAAALSVVEIAGSHSTMFSPTHAGSTAASFTRALLG